MYVFAIWSLNGLQWSNENQLQLVFIWSFGHLVRNFRVTNMGLKKTKYQNLMLEEERHAQAQKF